MKHDLRSRLERQWQDWSAVVQTSAVDYAVAGLGVVSGVLTARLLLPQGKGELTAILLWPALLGGVGALGLDHAVIYHAGRNAKRLGALAGVVGVLALVQGALTALVGWIVVPYVLASYDETVLLLTRLLFLWTPFQLASSFGQRILHGIGQFGRWNAIRVSGQFLYTVAIIAVWLVGEVTVPAVIGGFFLAQLLALVFTCSSLRNHVRDLRFDATLAKNLLHYGFRNLLASLAGQANHQLDQAVISALLGPRALGLYRVAATSARGVSLVSAGFRQVIISRIARDQEGAERLAQRWTKTAAFLLTIAAAAMALVMPWALPLAFGSEYTPAVVAAQILCLAAVFLGLKQIVYNAQRGQGKPQLPLYGELLGLVVTGAGLYLLLPLLGIEGASVTSALAYGVSCGAALVLMRRTARTVRSSTKEPTTAGEEAADETP